LGAVAGLVLATFVGINAADRLIERLGQVLLLEATRALLAVRIAPADLSRALREAVAHRGSPRVRTEGSSMFGKVFGFATDNVIVRTRNLADAGGGTKKPRSAGLS
jgi:hypothetical protein